MQLKKILLIAWIKALYSLDLNNIGAVSATDNWYHYHVLNIQKDQNYGLTFITEVTRKGEKIATCSIGRE